MFAGSETLVTAVPPEVAAKLCVPVEFELQVDRGRRGLRGGVAEVSSSVTVNALVALELAAPLKAVEVMASWVPVPAVMVSCWVPEVSPVAAAVMVGVPAAVSP